MSNMIHGQLILTGNPVAIRLFLKDEIDAYDTLSACTEAMALVPDDLTIHNNSCTLLISQTEAFFAEEFAALAAAYNLEMRLHGLNATGRFEQHIHISNGGTISYDRCFDFSYTDASRSVLYDAQSPSVTGGYF